MKKVAVRHTEPVAYVTKGKHRLKQYKNKSTVYLRNGDEFELELFNPTSDKVLAKIELNGNSIGAGIVLRPGERAFIERYIEESRKFMFQTYEVNGKSEEVKQAIANNGDVRVLFYKESVPYNMTWTTNFPTFGTISNTGSFGYDSLHTTNIGDSVNTFFSNTSMTYEDKTPCLDFLDTKISSRPKPSKTKSKNLLETGMIDKGSVSNQTFKHDYSTFDTYWSWQSEWKILPLSQKTIVSEDIKVFCTNCGTRQRKSSHKFCPNCGTKY